ncbi:hypothetical protein Cob_v009472 [Colletotrichum orbiculare MAFF 240422]|uniref:Uncharacterized protein n=2 Tax=Colletotrichum orbiculare species complex TaxID=2707354 RepID=N4V4S0_COLOR|nr:hypothetical protein Cob_v009472 [Colletotrichum orbiculare MAFF 240422]TDZ53998.1 hypothetical protein CTRI78_v006636 [Colletotrichum trifolii]
MQLAVLSLLLAPFALACSQGFTSGSNLSPGDYAWIFADYSVEDTASCTNTCARSCTAPGHKYGSCMGCARWKGNAEGAMDLPDCRKPITNVNDDGEYVCHGYGDQFWNCVTRCPPGYTPHDIGRPTDK